MLNNKEKAALVIIGLGTVGSLITTIYCCGQAKYYEGRISKYEELEPIMKYQSDLIKELIKPDNNEKLLREEENRQLFKTVGVHID